MKAPHSTNILYLIKLFCFSLLSSDQPPTSLPLLKYHRHGAPVTFLLLQCSRSSYTNFLCAAYMEVYIGVTTRLHQRCTHHNIRAPCNAVPHEVSPTRHPRHLRFASTLPSFQIFICVPHGHHMHAGYIVTAPELHSISCAN